MPLFSPRVLERHIGRVQADPQHVAILAKWAENLERGAYDVETQSDGEFIQRILIDVLGYVGSGGRAGTAPDGGGGPGWTVAKNQPVGRGNVDVALGRFAPGSASILAPMELKSAKTLYLDAIMPGRNKSPVEQAWEYAMDAKGARWALVSNYRVIRLYAIGYGRQDYELFDLSKMAEPSHYARFVLLLSAQGLLGGGTLALLEESGQAEKDVTGRLYRDYRDLRKSLIEEIGGGREAVRLAQTVLDRVLFVAFAEDRGLLPERTLTKAFEADNPFSPQPIWENFKGLFRAIDEGSQRLGVPGYNGGLFAADAALDDLHISDGVCGGFKKLGDYDFDSEISVNILGHIFEQSISDLEGTNAASGAPGKRKREGIFYTPPHITRHIVERAVGGWLAERRGEIGFDALAVDDDGDDGNGGKVNKKRAKAHIDALEAYLEALSGIKVLDPACGSGAFLNAVFDYLVREGRAVNDELARLRGRPSLFRWETHVLANNIYGVDLNRESVEITKLSLWLKTASKSEKLTYLDDNIKAGNSLIDDPALAGCLAFDWCREFSEIMQSGGFDVVVGNPPYVFAREKMTAAEKAHYRANYRSAQYQVNTYLLFIEKSIELLKNTRGRLGLVVPNAWLMVGSAENLRKLLLEETTIHSIANLLGRSFGEASVETVILDAQKKPAGEGHEIRVLVSGDNFEPALLHTRPQSAFATDAGNELRVFASDADARLLEKMACGSVPLDEAYEVRAGLIAYVVGKGRPKQSREDVINRIYDFKEKIDESTHKYLEGKDVGRYWHRWDGAWLRYGDNLAEPRNIRLFSSPAVIVREIAGKHPRCLSCAYTDGSEVLLFNPSNIAVLGRDPAYDLKYLLGILNSSLMSHYFTRSTPKAVRKLFPKIILADLRKFPIKRADAQTQAPIAQAVGRMLEAQKTLMEIATDFARLAEAELGIGIGGRSIGAWHELDGGRFLDAAKRGARPKAFDLADESRWLQHFDAEKEKTLAPKTAIAKLDAEIDGMVYNLYGLAEGEAAAVEAG